MYGEETYPGGEEAVSAITVLLFIQDYSSVSVYIVLIVLKGSPKHNKKAFHQCFVRVSCFTTGCVGMDKFNESQVECGLPECLMYMNENFTGIQVLYQVFIKQVIIYLYKFV